MWWLRSVSRSLGLAEFITPNFYSIFSHPICNRGQWITIIFTTFIGHFLFLSWMRLIRFYSKHLRSKSFCFACWFCLFICLFLDVLLLSLWASIRESIVFIFFTFFFSQIWLNVPTPDLLSPKALDHHLILSLSCILHFEAK